MCLAFGRDLAANEQLAAGHAAGAHPFADAALVAVGLRGIQQAIAQLHSRLNGGGRPGVVHQPGSQPQPGNTAAVSQRNAFL